MIFTQLAVLILASTITVLWRRTRQLRRDLQITQQELKVQRVVIDQPDTPPERRPRLRSLPLAAFM